MFGDVREPDNLICLLDFCYKSFFDFEHSVIPVEKHLPVFVPISCSDIFVAIFEFDHVGSDGNAECVAPNRKD